MPPAGRVAVPHGPCVAAGPRVYVQTTRQEHASTVLAECLCDLCHVQLSFLVLAVTYAGLENHPHSAAVKGKLVPSARPTEHLLQYLPRVRQHTSVAESSEAPLVPRHGFSESVKAWAQHSFLSPWWERAQEGGSSSDLSWPKSSQICAQVSPEPSRSSANDAYNQGRMPEQKKKSALNFPTAES